MSKVLVIGLDGATFELIEPWVEEGELPTFSRLMSEGSWGALKSTLPPLTVPAWAAMFTGKNPARLGLFGLADRKKGEYSIGGPPLSWEDLHPIWESAERFEREASVISVPTTSVPASGFSGNFVAGTGPMIGKSVNDKLAQPDSLDNWLRERDYRLHLRPSDASRKSPEGKRQYLKDLERLTESRFEVGGKLIEENWDLFIFSLFHTDMTQHIFWKDYMSGGEFGDAILDYYKKIDEKLRSLLERIEGPFDLVMVSDHGHTRLEKEIDLNRFLVENGWMTMESEEEHKVTRRGIAEWLTKLGLKRAYKKVKELPGVNKLDEKLRDSVPLDEHSSEDVSWKDTVAYSYSLAGVYLNLSGREPEGVVGENEYEGLREEIMEALAELKDPETGDLVVENVYKKEKVYAGPHLEDAPDILIDYKDPYQDSHSEPAPQHESVFNEPSSFFTSTHTNDGIFIAHGPDIKNSGKLSLEKQISLMDITPTVLQLLGNPIPENVDGKARKEVFKKDSGANQREPEYYEPPDSNGGEQELSQEENEEVKQRLEDLGYL